MGPKLFWGAGGSFDLVTRTAARVGMTPWANVSGRPFTANADLKDLSFLRRVCDLMASIVGAPSGGGRAPKLGQASQPIGLRKFCSEIQDMVHCITRMLGWSYGQHQ